MFVCHDVEMNCFPLNVRPLLDFVDVVGYFHDTHLVFPPWRDVTCRMSDTEIRLDVADTLCFQLGGAKRRMTWRQFILALGLHTEEEMAEA
ncbi:hypothetical protein Tco_0396001, partial [Tanacetum coccineum]